MALGWIGISVDGIEQKARAGFSWKSRVRAGYGHDGCLDRSGYEA